MGALLVMRIGIDFGGTKVEAAALDEAGNVVKRIRTANPGDYDLAVICVRDLVRAIESDLGGRCPVGIGAPGSVSPTSGLMRNSNSLYLNGRRFKEDLDVALDRPVRIANDADCFALSEATDGAGAGAKTVFGVILGTGCGGGLVVDGQLIQGANGIGGEWGHVPLPWADASETPGPECYCGQKGCLEQWISGTGLQRDYRAQTGRNLAGEEIVRVIADADLEAGAALNRLIDRLGRALALICNIVDPNAIVIGGGLSQVSEIYPTLPAIISCHAFSDAWSAKIAPARWGDSSGVRGAARLWSYDDSISLSFQAGEAEAR